MTNAETKVGRADEEAAGWLARLGATRVSQQDMEAFAVWRRDPLNRAAYERVEVAWRRTDAVADDPEIQAAARDALERAPRPRSLPRRAVILGGPVLAGAVAAVAAGLYWTSRPPLLSTKIGETRRVRLEDGTVVQLDTATNAEVLFSADRRLVQLTDGQALFEVAHDPDRPFTVRAGETEVTALGTIFTVRRDEDTVAVTLVSGVVSVTEGGTAKRRRRLQPGIQLTLNSEKAIEEAVDPRTATSWTRGRLIFKDTPLIEAVAEMNRYLDRGVVLDADVVAHVRINGAFETGDRAALVAAASDLFDLQATPLADGRVRLIKKG